MNNDAQHLRLLSIFHYVVAGLSGLYSLFALVYGGLGIAIVTGRLKAEEPEAVWVGWFLLVIAAGVFVFGVVFAVCLMRAGQFLQRRMHYTFCLVMAGVQCMFMPWGTVLGVFTIVVLIRPTVKALFEEGAAG